MVRRDLGARERGGSWRLVCFVFEMRWCICVLPSHCNGDLVGWRAVSGDFDDRNGGQTGYLRDET